MNNQLKTTVAILLFMSTLTTPLSSSAEAENSAGLPSSLDLPEDMQNVVSPPGQNAIATMELKARNANMRKKYDEWVKAEQEAGRIVPPEKDFNAFIYADSCYLDFGIDGKDMAAGPLIDAVHSAVLDDAREYAEENSIDTKGKTPEQILIAVNEAKWEQGDIGYMLPEWKEDDYTGIGGVTETTAAVENSIVILIDASGSMQGGKISSAKTTAARQIARLGPETELAVIAFSGNSTRTPFLAMTPSGRSRAISAVNSITADGGTPLAAAIRNAGSFIRGSANGSNITLIILSDGEETEGGDPPAEIRRLNDMNVTW